MSQAISENILLRLVLGILISLTIPYYFSIRDRKIFCRNSFYFIVVLLMMTIPSCSYKHYYIVRHAEKADPTADDPALSDVGITRAQTLADSMSGKRIDKIYVSDKIRTQQTARPTAEEFDLLPVIVPHSDLDRLISDLKNVKSKNILVVRHSEELHLIVNSLSHNDQITPIGDVYSHFFKITRRTFLWDRKYTLKRTTYGLP